jgi:hypothetical protein
MQLFGERSILSVHRALRTQKNTVSPDEWSEYHRVLTAVNASVAQSVKLSVTGPSTQVIVVEDKTRQQL